MQIKVPRNGTAPAKGCGPPNGKNHIPDNEEKGQSPDSPKKYECSCVVISSEIELSAFKGSLLRHRTFLRGSDTSHPEGKQLKFRK